MTTYKRKNDIHNFPSKFYWEFENLNLGELIHVYALNNNNEEIANITISIEPYNNNISLDIHSINNTDGAKGSGRILFCHVLYIINDKFYGDYGDFTVSVLPANDILGELYEFWGFVKVDSYHENTITSLLDKCESDFIDFH
jgi:hypothetical protein